ncbi:hypothetical protein EC991_007322 [Linnemannia zychae]|nr:hypothetical protein EC991_007322 [Linnemannia zychae]
MLQDDFPDLQAVRPVSKDSIDSSNPTAPGPIVYIDTYPDPVTQKPFVLWADVVQAFEDAVHVRYNSRVIPFLKGADFNPLMPHRIAAFPSAVLDVVVRSSFVGVGSATSKESLLETPSKPPSEQEQRAPSQDSVPTARRNPVYGLEEAAMDNYNHIDKPPTPKSLRGPQALLDEQTLSIKESSTIEQSVSADELKARQNPSATENSITTTTRLFRATLAKANQGDKKAQVTLGDMYKEGKEVGQDYSAAMVWYLKAANQGDPIGQRKVGLLHRNGLGVPTNIATATEWYLKSANQGDADSQYILGDIHGDSADALQDWGSIRKRYAEAMVWYLKAANQGLAHAEFKVGLLYAQGQGVDTDFTKAMEWYQKAAKKNDPDALLHIGLLYNNGHGVPRDVSSAVKWYKKAVAQGHGVAKECLEGLEQQQQETKSRSKNNGRLLNRLFK